MSAFDDVFSGMQMGWNGLFGGGLSDAFHSFFSGLGGLWNDISGTSGNNQFNASEAEKDRSWQEDQATITRAFNAEEAEKARQFNSAEAQKARDWEAMMSNTAYQRQIADMKAAGLNPAAAYLMNGASTPSGQAASGGAATAAVPNGSAAHSASGSSGGFLGLIASIAAPVLAKVASAKIMAKASSARDAAAATRTVSHEALKAQNALKLAELKYKHSKGLENYKANDLHSKHYWQEEPLDDGSYRHI